MSTSIRSLCRWTHRLQMPALAVERGMVVAANVHAAALWQAAGGELQGRRLQTLLKPANGREGRDAAKAATGPRVRKADAADIVIVRTLRGCSRLADAYTLVRGTGVAILLLLEQTRQRRQHRNLLREHIALKSRSAGQAIDHERYRGYVGSWVHDQVQQGLAATQMELLRAIEQLGRAPVEAAAALERAMAGLSDALQATRRIADDLRSPLLTDLGLVAALQDLVEGAAKSTGLEVALDASDGEVAAAEIGRLRASAFFRAAEQAIAAIADSAPSATVRLALRSVGDDRLELTLHGTGAGGVDLRPRLSVLRDWISELHGDLSVSPSPSESLRMVLSMELQPDRIVPRIADVDAVSLLDLFHRLPVGVIELRADGRVETMNPAAARLLLPVVYPRPLANLVEALQAELPGLASTLSEATGTTGQRFSVGMPGGDALWLDMYRQSRQRWLIVLSQHLASK